VPGQGFDPDFGIPCPDDSGAQLGWDGRSLTVSQWYPKKLLTLGADGTVTTARIDRFRNPYRDDRQRVPAAEYCPRHG